MSTDEDRFRQGIERLQEEVGYQFVDPGLLQQALTHRSFIHEYPGQGKDNERLEFLGDAVLEFVVSSSLFRRFPDLTEGDLSRARAALVKASSLASVARMLNLGELMRLGRGERISGGRNKDSLLANALEAVLGAVYLDGGLDVVSPLVHRYLKYPMERAPDRLVRRDPKGALQEWIQERGGPTPAYRVLRQTGPDHVPEYGVVVSVSGRDLAEGSGASKKEASVDAARKALTGLVEGRLSWTA
jgi:ribonuclease-3